MRIVIFCHSILSDWNNGNAHFLRGLVHELQRRAHDVRVFEPHDAWSRQNLEKEHGPAVLAAIRRAHPGLPARRYDLDRFDLDRALDHARLVLVHEWNPPELVRRIGEHHRRHGRYTLLFHDTHHRSVSAPEEMGRFDLSRYDGVLAFGSVIARKYVEAGWTARAWTWHEAADVRTFVPLDGRRTTGDLVWVGNWGDGERSRELREFLLEPARGLGLRTSVYGVRYPASALRALAWAGVHYRGWLPNHRAPVVFARHRVTVHVPRRPYVRRLPGIPTIRLFEALACGIPLVTSPWDDVEGLFTPGRDFLVARNGSEMQAHLRALVSDPDLARAVASHGRRTILCRHTCGHRVEQLLDIDAEVRGVAARRSHIA